MQRSLIAVVGAVMFLAGRFQADGQPQPAPADAEKPSLDEQYAKTYLSLVTLEFDKATRYNKQVNRVLTGPLVDSLRESVAVAEGWLAEVQAQQNGKHANPYLPWAEALLKIAKDNYDRYEKIKARSPDAVDPADFEESRLLWELAKLRVERAKELDLASTTDVLQWQLDLLREEVLRLNNQVVRLSTRE